MKTFTSAVTTLLFITSVGIGLAATGKEASPTMKEGVTEHTISGTLMRTQGEFYWIKGADGKETKIHVDNNTKKDKVATGEMVTAHVTDKGHATTLEHAK